MFDLPEQLIDNVKDDVFALLKSLDKGSCWNAEAKQSLVFRRQKSIGD
jgi:hypothetical protein